MSRLDYDETNRAPLAPILAVTIIPTAVFVVGFILAIIGALS